MKSAALSELLELSDSGVWGDEDAASGISVLRSTNFNSDGTLDLSKLTFRMLEERDRTRKLLRPGDILLEKSGGGPKQPVGRVCLYRGDTRSHAFGNFIARLRPRSNLLSEYLFYYLWHFHCTGKTSHYQKQTTGIRNLELKRYLGISVPLRSIAEQRRIVDLLSRAEGIVRLRREAQSKAQAITPALFLDMFGDPATNLKGQTVATLGDLIAIPIRNGISPSRAGRHKGRVLTLSAITRGAFDDSAVKEAMFAAPLADGDEVSARDFLVCRGNGNKSLVGVGCFPHHDMPGVAFPDTAIAVRPKSDVLTPRFLAAQWQSQWVRQQIDGIAKTTNGTFKINQAGLSGIKLILPPLLAQRAFEERVGSVESILRQQSEALKRAEATFQSLLARTFGGKPTAAVPAEEAAVA